MEVTLGTVSKKGAGKNLWTSIRDGVTTVAANLFVPPLTVEATGHRSMLEFGGALALGEPTFTFPRARNLKSGGDKPR